ncbi:MAG: acyl-CoA mutase large subunit family protein [Anaerolineae bacterium]|nr:acyl-CoA mutase large subunit family protein [Anaerolineae bacterium]MCB9106615.1 acyl-CoA mutase large subunit family protein [Anaerolineales bacterium]
MTTESQSKQNGRLLSEFPPPTYEAWREAVDAQLKGAPFEKRLVTKTYEGIDVQPLYRQEDLEGLSHLAYLPGFPPYVRGGDALGNNQNAWLICQEIPYSTAEEFNQAIRYDLERGQTAVNLRLDKATLLGQDPDEAQVGDVGLGGVSIATVDDLAKALDGIDLTKTPLYIQSHSAAMPTMALLMALAKKKGIATDSLQGGIEMDPLGILAREGDFPRSVAGAYDVMAQMITWAKDNAPQLKIVTVHGEPYADSGASAVEELGYVLATATEYLREMVARGLAVDDVAPRMRFSFAVGSNYFMEVAKLRAARMVWAKVVKAFGGSEASQKMTMHVRSGYWNKTIHDTYVNMLRTTTEAFAGAVAGCDSMHTAQFDEAIRPPDEFSRRIARNTQLIIQQEAHVTKVVDPAGGSWYVEKLTDTVARKVWELFQGVEKMGGMYAALKEGAPQKQVAATAEARLNSLASRKDVLVGTNKYANILEELPAAKLPDYAALHAKRAKYVGDYRTAPGGAGETNVLDKLSQILDGDDESAMGLAIAAAVAGATLGEIARTLRKGDEDKASVQQLCVHRGSYQFEELRAFSEDYLQKTGHRPQVFLANMGPIPQHKPRADFSTDFFQVGGFEVLTNNGFDSPEAAAQAALGSGAPVVVICSTDADYPNVVAPITQTIKAASPQTTVIVAGYPADQIEAHKAAGVDDFIHVRANTYKILANLQSKLGGA